MSPHPAVFFEAWASAISMRETTSKDGMADSRGGEGEQFGAHFLTADGVAPGEDGWELRVI